jgi:hypothetical protein
MGFRRPLLKDLTAEWAIRFNLPWPRPLNRLGDIWEQNSRDPVDRTPLRLPDCMHVRVVSCFDAGVAKDRRAVMIDSPTSPSSVAFACRKECQASLDSLAL